MHRTSSSSAHPTRGRLRLLRLTVLSSASLLLALGAHTLGGGARPAIGNALLLLAVTGAVALVATARRCRLPFLLPLLGAEQLLLHLLLSADAAAGRAGADPMPVGHVGPLPCTAPTGGGITGGGVSERLAEGGMLAAHVLATALTAWLLTRGEAALWRFADRVVDAALPALTRQLQVRRRPQVARPLPAPRGLALPEDAAPRGPPALAPAVG